MEQRFLDFLDKISSFPLGTLIGIIIGGGLIVVPAIIGIFKIKKIYDAHLIEQNERQKADEKFKQDTTDALKELTVIKEDISNLSMQHEILISEVNVKIGEVWSSVVEAQKDSKEGDITLETQMKKYEDMLNNVNIKLKNMDDKTTLLIESDKESIKSFIIDKYYEARERGYIKVHVLQVLEVRYEKYLQENGNTYIGRLMEEIRHLPTEPTDNQQKLS